MNTYRVVITATGLRNVGALDGAEELIQSTFLAEGSGILAATKEAIMNFKMAYTGVYDLEITGFYVQNTDEKPDDSIHVEMPTHLKEQAS